MSGEWRRYSVRAHVEVQLAYLHGSPAWGTGVCRVCFGACGPSSVRCVPCEEIDYRAGRMAADLVVPITYRNGSGGQHSQNLRMYKQEPHNRTARRSLTALFAYFCLHHISCVKEAANVDRFTHVCFVPSTKNPSQAVHPLEETLSDKVRSLRGIRLSVNQRIPAESRAFHKDWFEANGVPGQGSEADVLLLDDTWVTGARAQSAAYCLKQAGARKVVVLVLARQVNPDFAHAKPLVKRISETSYEMDSCAFHTGDVVPAPRSS